LEGSLNIKAPVRTKKSGWSRGIGREMIFSLEGETIKRERRKLEREGERGRGIKKGGFLCL